jgi:5'-nucleotidase
MKKEIRILVTNDDGVNSPGLHALAQALSKVGSVVVVAPDRERSAVSHSLTLHHPLRAEQMNTNIYSVDGTPTDCVTLAVMGIMKENKPALIFSGINKGQNLGDDVTYSGTVSAAMEGTLLNIPSVAMSLVGDQHRHFDVAAEVAVFLAKMILSQELPPDTLLNVNVPDLPKEKIAGMAITRLDKRYYSETIVEKVDPRGRTYYWIGGENPLWLKGRGTDYEAISENKISITPLHMDLTNYAALEELRRWRLDF